MLYHSEGNIVVQLFQIVVKVHSCKLCSINYETLAALLPNSCMEISLDHLLVSLKQFWMQNRITILMKMKMLIEQKFIRVYGWRHLELAALYYQMFCDWGQLIFAEYAFTKLSTCIYMTYYEIVIVHEYINGCSRVLLYLHFICTQNHSKGRK